MQISQFAAFIALGCGVVQAQISFVLTGDSTTATMSVSYFDSLIFYELPMLIVRTQQWMGRWLLR